MERVLAFFRDTLNGTTYIVVSLVCTFLIFVCIHFLRKKNSENKQIKKEEVASRVVLLDPTKNNKRVEVSLDASNNSSSVSNVNLTNVTSVLATQDIYSGTGVVEQTDVDTVTVPEKVETLTPEVEKKSTAPVMINPMEVAMVSSTMSVIGATSEQKKAIADNEMELDSGTSKIVSSQEH